MHELIVNLHIHTKYSDGSGSHAEVCKAALKANLDVVITTDHNVLVKGMDGYLREDNKKVLLMVGEEIHDQHRVPQKNHLLVFGVSNELAHLAHDPQALLDAVQNERGLSFIAHPVDPAMPDFGEPDISWTDWEVTGFTGIELWNGFSEMKTVARSKLEAVVYAFFPELIPHGPLPQTLKLFDRLTSQPRRVVAIGGSDAHAQHKSLGFLHKVIFPYEYHFSTINTHLLTPARLCGDLMVDKKMVLDSLAAGHCYIGNDLTASTRGFTFSVQGRDGSVIMGDQITVEGSFTLQTRSPSPGEIRLLKNGTVIKSLQGQSLVHITDEPGIYRVEIYKKYLGKSRGWIFSNPIYVN
jgi:hypothetical protein